MIAARALDRFRHRPGVHRRRPLRAGALFIALAGLVVFSALTLEVPFLSSPGQTVTAHVADAGDAKAGQPVRIGGIEVGRVEELDEHPSGRGAQLTLSVDDDVEVHSDARASLRWRTMFGRNLYVDLEPGTPGSGALGSREIPASRTSSPVEFDELLRPLDATGRRAVQTLFREGDRALAEPRAPGAAIDELAPAAASVDPGLRALRGRRGDLGRVVRGLAQTLEGLGRSEEQLAQLIDSADTTLAVTAARSADLSAALGQAPPTLARTRATMRRLRLTLDELDPLVRALRPGVLALEPAAASSRRVAREVRVVLQDLRPALSDLDPALQRLRTAGLEGTPVVAGLTPSVRRTRHEIIPALERDPGSGLRNFQAIGPFFAAAASSAGEFDRSGHMLRFQAFFGEGSLNPSACQLTSQSDRQNACEELVSTLTELLTPARSRRERGAGEGR